ncbi:MAG: hypothetical protein LBI71_02740 [Enterobacteriaceae bacterium]|jgi:Tol biopolymer transport system component|nr:hypothetical protein [Enterobacteriaceae bacterium]
MTNLIFPTNLTGKLLFHTYISYSDKSSQLHLYDFKTQELIQLSQDNWNVIDPMNAIFTPDGKWIIFMGVINESWHLFMYELGTGSKPVNLTEKLDGINYEDPKISRDGKCVYFKQDGGIYRAWLEYKNGKPELINPISITKFNPSIEYSMPFPSSNEQFIYYVLGSGGGELGIYRVNIATGEEIVFDDEKDVGAYYPIVRKDGMVFYSKWKGEQNRFDQIKMKKLPEETAISLGFNELKSDNSDPWPVDDSNYIFFCSTREGNYQIYLGEISTGQSVNLKMLGLNNHQELNYLAPCYFQET